MNAMLDRLETSAQRQRQFVSDASHELRSPLAVDPHQPRGRAAQPRPRRLAAVAQRALAEDVRMERHGRRPARRWPGSTRPRARPLDTLPEVDLDELVLDEHACSRGASASTRPVSAGRVARSPPTSSRAWCATCSTTPAATRADGRPSACDGRRRVELTVDDDGPGIPAEDAGAVFERFTRLDDGRARDAGGLGLGLAIVKAITEHHGGTSSIEDAPIGGARLRVRLPAA